MHELNPAIVANKDEQAKVAIIGGGLAGLYSAYILSKQNISVDIYEAKATLGGRILGLPTKSPEYLIDLGPSWVFPHQTNIQALIAELGLKLKKQFAKGDALFQQHPSLPVRQMNGVAPPDMYQIVGGTYSLINALVKAIQTQQDNSTVNLATSSKVISCVAVNAKTNAQKQSNENAGWELTIERAFGEKRTKLKTQYQQVIFATPPRIALPIVSHLLSTLEEDSQHAFKGLEQAFQKTPTWMAAQAKFTCQFSQASWRKKGLSGQAFSQTGPLVEIHDAGHEAGEDDQSTVHALFGFVGLPAMQRLALSEQEISKACLAQILSIFDINESECTLHDYHDWAKDNLVATATDQAEASQHPIIDMRKWKEKLNVMGLYFAGSEFSTIDAGYMEGAIVASQQAIQTLTTRTKLA